MAVAGYGPGRARPMGPLHAAVRSASNCEKEATAEREARDTRSGLAPKALVYSDEQRSAHHP